MWVLYFSILGFLKVVHTSKNTILTEYIFAVIKITVTGSRALSYFNASLTQRGLAEAFLSLKV